MSHLDVNPDAVTDVGSRIAAAAETDAPQGGVSPAAQDPVSVALAQTFAARMAAITGHSSVAAAITDTRANLAKGSAHTYAGQEAANRAGLGQGPMPGTVSAPSLPTGSLPTAAAPTTIPSPAIGTPPPTGKAIAALIHSGAGPSGLYSAASQMRGHAAELTATADQLRSGAVDMAGDWDSEAGKLASSRITELGTWYGAHADHATAAATAIENQADNFGRARSAIPRPEQFADVERRLEMAMAANAMPGALGRYGPVIAQLKAELAKLNGEALSGYADYTTGAGDPGVVGDPLEPPPRPGSDIQMFDHDFPLTPQDEDPPHGKDPRYWLDASKIIHVPEGQLAPYGYMQVGPELWYPDLYGGYNVNPPPPSKYPIGIEDITSGPPGGLGPSGSQTIAQTPDGNYYAPKPGGYTVQPPWPAPQQPIDVRDIVHVPRGTLAPSGYIEYLPEWFIPGPRIGAPR